MHLTKNRTFQIQSDFAQFCKSGDLSIQIPGAGKYIGQYHELMHNIVVDTIESNFPLAKKLLKKKDWNKLLNDFILHHSCISPQIWTMPREFRDDVLERQHTMIKKYPPLKDTLIFDWKETEIFMMEDKIVPYFVSRGDIQKDSLVLNPEIELVHFEYPVFSKAPQKIIASDLGNYYVVFYRNLDDGEVNYWEIPPAYLRVLELLMDAPQKVLQIAQIVCEEAQIVFDKEVENKVLAFAEICIERKIILGYS